MENLLHWIWLSLSCTPGNETFRKLIEAFKTAEDIYCADDKSISSCIGSRSRDYNSLIDKDLEKAESILNFCREKNVGILIYADERFPDSLRRIKNPPVLLYYRGVLPDFKNEFCISVVGTRSITDYGKRNTFVISRDLAKAGALIVSGMAIGVDGVALAAALSEGAKTVAVIGSGIDVCYPMEHLHLAREIVKRGCVMTEYAPGVRPERFNFPRRNRIISALSYATLVMEGREKSGALYTARFAMEQGRRAYALPGNVGNKNSEATNLLIKSGAKPFTSADDVVRDIESVCPGRLNPFKMLTPSAKDMNHILAEYKVAALSPDDAVFKHFKKKEAKAAQSFFSENEGVKVNPDTLNSLSAELRTVYQRIPKDKTVPVDTLVCEKFTLRDVMRALLKLEIMGLVAMMPGDAVRRRA